MFIIGMLLEVSLCVTAAPPGNEEIIYLYIYKLYFLMKGAYCFAAILIDTAIQTKQHQTQYLRPL